MSDVPLKLYMAKVTKQRDNGPGRPDLRGEWVCALGFSKNVKDAQIFTSEKQIKERLALDWEFEIYEFKAGASTARIEQTDCHTFKVTPPRERYVGLHAHHSYDCHVFTCDRSGCPRPPGDCDGPPICTPTKAARDRENP